MARLQASGDVLNHLHERVQVTGDVNDSFLQQGYQWLGMFMIHVYGKATIATGEVYYAFTWKSCR